METSDVRRQVAAMIERARKGAADRKARNDEAAREYSVFLDRIAVPLLRQVADSLKPAGFAFKVFTPSGSVRLMSDSRSDDYIEIALDTTGAVPEVVGTTSLARGHRVVTSEKPIGEGSIGSLTGEDVLAFVMKELEAFVR